MNDWPENLMDFILPCGKRLGDATGKEVEAAAELYGKRAAEAERKLRLARSLLRGPLGCE